MPWGSLRRLEAARTALAHSINIGVQIGAKLFEAKPRELCDLAHMLRRNVLPLRDGGRLKLEEPSQLVLLSSVRFEVGLQGVHAAIFSQNEIQSRANFQSVGILPLFWQG